MSVIESSFTFSISVENRERLLKNITFVLGLRGTGKTTYAKNHFSLLAPHRFFIVSNTKDWSEFVRRPMKTPIGSLDFYKHNHRISFDYSQLILRSLNVIRTWGKFYIVFDDLDAFLQSQRSSNPKRHLKLLTVLNYIALMGRHNDIGALVISHRLTNIPQNMLSEAYKIVCFTLHHPDDLRSLRAVLSKEDVDKIKALSGHERAEFELF